MTMIEGMVIGAILGFNAGTGLYKVVHAENIFSLGAGLFMAISNPLLLLYLNGVFG